MRCSEEPPVPNQVRCFGGFLTKTVWSGPLRSPRGTTWRRAQRRQEKRSKETGVWKTLAQRFQGKNNLISGGCGRCTVVFGFESLCFIGKRCRWDRFMASSVSIRVFLNSSCWNKGMCCASLEFFFFFNRKTVFFKGLVSHFS